MRRKVKKTGLRSLMQRVSTDGLQCLDARSAGYRTLMVWKQELCRDLGGEESLTVQERTLVDLALRTKLLIDHVDTFLMEQNSLINKKRRSAYPVLAQRSSLVNVLLNVLKELGLKRRPKDIGSLEDYLKSKEAGHEHSAGDGGSEAIQKNLRAEEGIAE
jgi:hypothetical protein